MALQLRHSYLDIPSLTTVYLPISFYFKYDVTIIGSPPSSLPSHLGIGRLERYFSPNKSCCATYYSSFLKQTWPSHWLSMPRLSPSRAYWSLHRCSNPQVAASSSIILKHTAPSREPYQTSYRHFQHYYQIETNSQAL